jgi:hypothetical protein
MSGWIETTHYAASEPGRVAVLVALAQAERAVDEMGLAQMAGLLYQRIVGQPIETAVMLKHVSDLAGQGLLERDQSGFRWQLTALGTLVSRPWASGAVEPPGTHPLEPSEVRAWRDRLVRQLEEDHALAAQAGLSAEELLAGLSTRLAELRVLNRVLGEETLPAWLAGMVPTGDE